MESGILSNVLSITRNPGSWFLFWLDEFPPTGIMNYIYEFPIIESINLLLQKQMLAGPFLFKGVAFLLVGSRASSCCGSYSMTFLFLPLQRPPLFLPSTWRFAAVFSGFHILVLRAPHSDPLFLWPRPSSLHISAKGSLYLIFRSVPFLLVLRQASFVTHFSMFLAHRMLLTLVSKSLRHKSWNLRVCLRVAPLEGPWLRQI